MKYKTMDRAQWRRVKSRRVTANELTKNGVQGKESFILIGDVTDPLIVGTPDGGTLNVADAGYGWYQRAFKGEETWLTAAFDEKGTLLQIYFDVTAGNDFSDPRDPGFSDLYLDVVLTPGHGIMTLDRDELDAALESGDVTPAQHRRALEVGAALAEDLRQNGEALCREVTAAALALRRRLTGGVDVVAALIKKGDRFLICQRPAHKARGLLWEFVGGKVEPGETKEEALVRECREELGVRVAPSSVFCTLTHVYPDLTVNLTLFHAEITSGEPQLLEHNALKWITRDEIDGYAFCPADEEILKKIRAM